MIDGIGLKYDEAPPYVVWRGRYGSWTAARSLSPKICQNLLLRHASIVAEHPSIPRQNAPSRLYTTQPKQSCVAFPQFLCVSASPSRDAPTMTARAILLRDPALTLPQLGDTKATTAAVDLHESLYFLQHVSHSPRHSAKICEDADARISVDKMPPASPCARAEGSTSARATEWLPRSSPRASASPTCPATAE